MKLALREAETSDETLLLDWRNEEVTRMQSFTSDPIPPDQHHRWFASKLAARSAARIWILTADDRPAGQVRYETKDAATAEVSISIDVMFRGRGLAVELLRMSAPRACRELSVSKIRGLVKMTNAASMAAFARAGFVRSGDGGDGTAVFVFTCGGRAL